MTFTTRNDARIYVANTGVIDWEWDGAASAEGFAAWLWQNYDAEPEDFEAALSAYLLSVGEEPSDYGL